MPRYDEGMGGSRNHGQSRRIITRVIVFLLLGAIVNVAVAWGYGLWSSPDEQNGEILEPATVALIRQRFGMPSLLPDETVGYQTYGSGLTFQVIHDGISIQGSTLSWAHTAISVACGWPARSMRCGVISQNGAIEYLHSIQPPKGFSASVLPMLPCAPLWPGFAINTIFYAAILWLFFTVPFALRRHRRIKRGQCPACAYPIGTSPVCTECGNPVQPRPPRGDGA